MIVIEGCDNSGKSTLARKLTDDLPAMYIRRAFKFVDGDDIVLFTGMVLSMAARFPTVLDRAPWIGENVYGPVIRGKSLLNDDHMDQVWSLIRSRRTLTIYCRPPTNIILRGLNTREQMAGVKENAMKLVAQYDDVMKTVERKTNVLRYDYSKDAYEQLRYSVSAFYGKVVQ